MRQDGAQTVAMDLWIDPIVEQYNDYQWYTVNRDELEDVVVENEVMGILAC